MKSDATETVEFEGKQVTVPKGLKDAMMLHADYQEKSASLGKEREEVAAQRQAVAQQAQVTEEDLNLRAQFLSTAATLEQYRHVDWNAWSAQDAETAQRHFMQYQQLERQQAETGNQLRQRAEQQQKEALDDMSKRFDAARSWARDKIPGYTDEIGQKNIEFALSKGITDADLKAAMNPTVFEILHLARIGAEVSGKPAAKPPASKPKPTSKVRGRSSPKSIDPYEGPDDMDAYAKWRAGGGGGG